MKYDKRAGLVSLAVAPDATGFMEAREFASSKRGEGILVDPLAERFSIAKAETPSIPMIELRKSHKGNHTHTNVAQRVFCGIRFLAAKRPSLCTFPPQPATSHVSSLDRTIAKAQCRLGFE